MTQICARCVIQPRSVIPTLLGLPYDAGSSFMRGPASAPKFIRRALGSGASNTWSENLRDITGPGGLVDGGDLALTDADPRAAIEAGVRALVDRGGSPLLLGGDHSVTYPAMRAVRAFHPTLTILHIDAHSDLYHEFGGNPNSHACPFARVMEEGLADRLVQVGIRTLNVQQRAQALVKTIIYMAHCLEMEVLAEGVETPAQAEFLKLAGCDRAQGFFFHQPMTPAKVATCLTSKS